jgi:hypothetical protein
MRTTRWPSLLTAYAFTHFLGHYPNHRLFVRARIMVWVSTIRAGPLKFFFARFASAGPF